MIDSGIEGSIFAQLPVRECLLKREWVAWNQLLFINSIKIYLFWGGSTQPRSVSKCFYWEKNTDF